MGHTVGQWAPCWYTVGRIDCPGQGTRPAYVALPRVLGGCEGDEPPHTLETSLEGEVGKGDVVVALLAVDVGRKGIVPTSGRELGLGGGHPGRRVGSLPFALAPGGGVPFSDKPLLEDGSPSGRPKPIRPIHLLRVSPTKSLGARFGERHFCHGLNLRVPSRGSLQRSKIQNS